MPTAPVELLHAQYRQLDKHDPAALTADQRKSLQHFRAELLLLADPNALSGANDLISRWVTNLHALQVFVAREGRMPRENNRQPESAFADGERRLAQWVRAERRATTATRRCTYQLARLACIPGYRHQPLDDRWNSQRQQYQEFTLRTHRAPRLRSQDAVERSLAAWAAKQRLHRRRGTLNQHRTGALERLDFWGWGHSVEHCR